MVYVFLNVFLFLILVWFSSFADMHSEATRSKQLISPILLLAVVALMNGISILFSFWGNSQIANIAGKIYMLLIADFSILVTSYVCRFPICKKGVMSNILVIGLLILGFYITFSKIEYVATSLEEGLVVHGEDFPLFGITWDIVYELIFLAGLPLISVISIFRRVFPCCEHIISLFFEKFCD